MIALLRVATLRRDFLAVACPSSPVALLSQTSFSNPAGKVTTIVLWCVPSNVYLVSTAKWLILLIFRRLSISRWIPGKQIGLKPGATIGDREHH